jgi:hypothetical protein
MIEIRPDQMEVFNARARASFLQRVLVYLREAHGSALSEISDEDLCERVRLQIGAASSYGVRTEAAVVQFIEMCFAFGDDFHSSPSYPEAERILASNSDGTRKMADLLAAARNGFGAQT